jgi:hypothetical protein
MRTILHFDVPSPTFGPAAADVAGHGAVYIFIARLWIRFQQGNRRHDLPCLPIAALASTACFLPFTISEIMDASF